MVLQLGVWARYKQLLTLKIVLVMELINAPRARTDPLVRIQLAQDRDRWQALVTAVMNLQVP